MTLELLGGSGGGSGGGEGEVFFKSSGPAFASGLYYAVPDGIPNATTTGNVHWFPFTVDRAITIDRIGYDVTTAVGGETVRVGLHADNNGKPGTVALDAGTFDASTTGIKEITVSAALEPGRYWGYFGPSHGNIAVKASTNNTNWVGRTSAAVAMDYAIAAYTGSGVTAAAMTANPTVNDGPGGAPRMILRVA